MTTYCCRKCDWIGNKPKIGKMAGKVCPKCGSLLIRFEDVPKDAPPSKI